MAYWRVPIQSIAISEGSSKQIEDEERDDDVEVRWLRECMASVFQWDSRAASIEFQWLIARQIHQLLNWE